MADWLSIMGLIATWGVCLIQFGIDVCIGVVVMGVVLGDLVENLRLGYFSVLQWSCNGSEYDYVVWSIWSGIMNCGVMYELWTIGFFLRLWFLLCQLLNFVVERIVSWGMWTDRWVRFFWFCAIRLKQMNLRTGSLMLHVVPHWHVTMWTMWICSLWWMALGKRWMTRWTFDIHGI